MNDSLVESGTASSAFGAASMTKAKPITALYQFQFWAGSLPRADKKPSTRSMSARHPALLMQRTNRKQSSESASTPAERNQRTGLAAASRISSQIRLKSSQSCQERQVELSMLFGTAKAVRLLPEQEPHCPKIPLPALWQDL